MNERPRITQEMIHLYDEYTHVTLDRRGFMDKLAKLAGSSAAAAAIAPMLAASKASAAMIEPDDARLITETVTYPSPSGQMSGYLARPADATGPLPGIIVVHENRGLNPHIEDVARRAALEGFVALAPDFLAPIGGTPDDDDQAREKFRELDRSTVTGNAVASLEYLRDLDITTGKIGAVGFCWGGGTVNQLAVASPDLLAAAPFYGAQPSADDAAKIEAKLMLHYAGLDERTNAGIPAFEQALKAAGVDYTLYIYEGANHAFHNDTSEARYDRAAAELAWSRTMAFFKETLG
jgi:carboxymethylenebutenolidase